MANISPNMVKDLRDKTGAGIMDCKNALNETQGDAEAAVDWLRKKGLAKAAKKAGRVAAEGLIGLSVRGDAGALVEVNAETDFVARNDEFKDFVKRAADLGLEAGGDVEKLLSANLDGASVDETLKGLIAKIGENMSVRRAYALSVKPGVVASYIHNASGPELGRIGVLVAIQSEGDKDRLLALGRQIAMHIAAANPMALSVEHLPPDVVAKERDIQREIAAKSGKPDHVIEKMVEGRMKKFYEEVVLLEQIFVIDGERRISKVLEDASKELGTKVEIAGFVRFAVGEGIDKGDPGDFASEVKSLSGK